MFSPPTPQMPQAPPPPPNPPMFGQKGAGKQGPWAAGPNPAWGGTMLGGGNPTNTGMKTLLGQ